MSRFAIPSKDPELQVTVGWDPPLQTFFAQVERGQADSDDLVLWLGTRYREHGRPEGMAAALSPYADLKPPIVERLNEDRRTARALEAAEPAREAPRLVPEPRLEPEVRQRPPRR